MIHQTACRAAKINPANTATGAGKLLRVLATKLQGDRVSRSCPRLKPRSPFYNSDKKNGLSVKRGRPKSRPRSEQFPTP